MEVNRIILIGNGFDLAHGLKTGYKDFCNFLIQEELNIIFKEFTQYKLNSHAHKTTLESKFILITDINNQKEFKKNFTISYKSKKKDEKEKFKILKELVNYNCLIFKNNFFGKLIQLHIENWVDLEDAYFKELIKCNEHEVKTLNIEFEIIKNEFENYLAKYIIPNLEKLEKNIFIQNILSSSVNLDETSSIFRNKLKKEKEDIKTKHDDLTSQIRSLNHQLKLHQQDINQYLELSGFTNHNQSRMFYPELNLEETKSKIEHLKLKIQEKESDLLTIKDPIFPLKFTNNSVSINKHIYLNFNYTNTLKLYVNKNQTTGLTNLLRRHEYINIHGEVNQKDNPIIFGYGDERGDEFIDILKKSNDFLKNIKSYWYSNNENYRKLLDLINEKEYQIIILGHSCGMSDRVLLSTLFEHKNCISIKPYYYQKEDYDNFQDTIMNISRSFLNKINMRDLVVNKRKTEPYSIEELIQNK